MRAMDAILAFPALILAMAVTVALGTGIVTGAVGILIGSIPWYARVVRSEVVRLRNRVLSRPPRRLALQSAASTSPISCPGYCRPWLSRPRPPSATRSLLWLLSDLLA